jgi:hypothetical protein
MLFILIHEKTSLHTSQERSHKEVTVNTHVQEAVVCMQALEMTQIFSSKDCLHIL